MLPNKYTSLSLPFILIPLIYIIGLIFTIQVETLNDIYSSQIYALGQPGAPTGIVDDSLCGLDAVICPNEGKASWLRYELEDSCATRDWPKGTRLEVRMAGAAAPSIICVVRDSGPDKSVFPERIIDLNYDQFAQLASPEVGVIDVIIKELK